MKKKKSWSEKLASCKNLPRIETIPESMEKRWGIGTLVIPTPMEVDELMNKVPHGKLTTINEIRKILAIRYGTAIACPITVGVFAWIAANAAAEKEVSLNVGITPYWRTLKSNGELNPKYPGGLDGQKAKLEAEGHKIVSKGKKTFVDGFADHLI